MDKKRVLGYVLMGWPIVLVVALNVYMLVMEVGLVMALKVSGVSGLVLGIVLYSITKGVTLTTIVNK